MRSEAGEGIGGKSLLVGMIYYMSKSGFKMKKASSIHSPLFHGIKSASQYMNDWSYSFVVKKTLGKASLVAQW